MKLQILYCSCAPISELPTDIRSMVSASLLICLRSCCCLRFCVRLASFVCDRHVCVLFSVSFRPSAICIVVNFHFHIQMQCYCPFFSQILFLFSVSVFCIFFFSVLSLLPYLFYFVVLSLFLFMSLFCNNNICVSFLFLLVKIKHSFLVINFVLEI